MIANIFRIFKTKYLISMQSIAFNAICYNLYSMILVWVLRKSMIFSIFSIMLLFSYFSLCNLIHFYWSWIKSIFIHKKPFIPRSFDVSINVMYQRRHTTILYLSDFWFLYDHKRFTSREKSIFFIIMFLRCLICWRCKQMTVLEHTL